MRSSGIGRLLLGQRGKVAGADESASDSDMIKEGITRLCECLSVDIWDGEVFMGKCGKVDVVVVVWEGGFGVCDHSAVLLPWQVSRPISFIVAKFAVHQIS